MNFTYIHGHHKRNQLHLVIPRLLPFLILNEICQLLDGLP